MIRSDVPSVRVLQITKALTAGGAENLIKALSIRAMSQGVKSEVAHVLPADPTFARDFQLNGIETHALGGAKSIWPLRLARLMHRRDYDIVHVHSPLPGSVARIVARSLRNSRLITTEHNSWTAYHPLTRILNRMTIGLDDVTIAVSGAAVNSMKGRGATKAFSLLHGIDLSEVRAMSVGRLKLHETLDLPDTCPVFACVAHNRPAKDHPTLLRALQELRLSNRSFHCVLVGQGTDDKSLAQIIHDYGLSTYVTALGPRHDVPEIIRQSTAVVLSSIVEGFPVVIMEAAALGVPVVATRVGGVPEQLTDDVNALLVESGQPAQLAQALASLIDQPDKIRRLSRGLSKISDRFDLNHSLAEYLTIYKSSSGLTTI